MRIHASCAARPGPGGFDAVLLLGDSGTGKSDLLLRLIARGWQLVADDQVDIEAGICSPPPPLAGLLEVRGLGLFRLDHVPAARLRLAAHLDRAPDRLPAPARHQNFDVAEINIDPSQPSAPERLALAFDALTGQAINVVGAFAA